MYKSVYFGTNQKEMYFIDQLLSGINNRWTTDLLTTIILPAGTTEKDMATSVQTY